MPSRMHSTATLAESQAELPQDRETTKAGPETPPDEVTTPIESGESCLSASEDRDEGAAPSDEERPGGSGNRQTPTTDIMGVKSRHQGKGVQVVAVSLDWLSLSVYGWWSPEPFRDTRENLEKARELAQLGNEDAAYIVGPEGDRVWVSPTGRRHGCYCRYSLTWKGIMIDVVDRAGPSDHSLSVYVQIPSATLMAIGCEFEAAEQVKTLLTSLGFHWEHEIVGRTDPCADMLGIRPAELGEAIQQGHYVGYARKFRPYCEPGPDGRMEWGNWEAHPGGQIMLRAYDKYEETIKSGDLTKLQLMLARWGDDLNIATGTTRVEFELKRKALKEFGVESLEDWRRERGNIMAYLTKTWLRVTEGKPDKANNNQGRAETCDVWQKIQEAFAAAFGEATVKVKRIRNLGQGCAKLIAQQVVGYASRIAAQSGRAIDTVQEAFQFMLDELPGIDDGFVKKVELKRRRLERSSPGVVLNLDDIPF